jgi:hypothetical protein
MNYSIVWFALSVVCYGSYIMYHHVRKVRIMKGLKCQPATRMPQQDWLGIGIFIQQLVALRNNRFLDWTASLFEANGNTFEFVKFGKPTIYTAEPENIKAILATQFEDFEIGWMRSKALSPLTGLGVFTSDGEFLLQ